MSPREKKKLPEGKFKIIRIPTETKMETGKLMESEFYDDLKKLSRYILSKTGDLFYWLEEKVPRKKEY